MKTIKFYNFRMESMHAQIFKGIITATMLPKKIQNVSKGLVNSDYVNCKYMAVDIHAFNVVIDNSNLQKILDELSKFFVVKNIPITSNSYWLS